MNQDSNNRFPVDDEQPEVVLTPEQQKELALEEMARKFSFLSGVPFEEAKRQVEHLLQAGTRKLKEDALKIEMKKTFEHLGAIGKPLTRAERRKALRNNLKK